MRTGADAIPWPSDAMDLSHALLVVAGVAAGTVNAMAGGGSLITFPALIATGLRPGAANVTNSVAVCPGLRRERRTGSRAELATGAAGRRLRPRSLPTAVVGTAVGCALLLATPARAFDVVVPFLVLGAAAVLAFQPRLRGVVGHPRDMSPRRRTVALHAMVGRRGGLRRLLRGGARRDAGRRRSALVLDETLARITALKNALSAVGRAGHRGRVRIFGPVDWARWRSSGAGHDRRRLRRAPGSPGACRPGCCARSSSRFGTAVGLILLWRAFT